MCRCDIQDLMMRGCRCEPTTEPKELPLATVNTPHEVRRAIVAAMALNSPQLKELLHLRLTFTGHGRDSTPESRKERGRNRVQLDEAIGDCLRAIPCEEDDCKEECTHPYAKELLQILNV